MTKQLLISLLPFKQKSNQLGQTEENNIYLALQDYLQTNPSITFPTSNSNINSFFDLVYSEDIKKLIQTDSDLKRKINRIKKVWKQYPTTMNAEEIVNEWDKLLFLSDRPLLGLVEPEQVRQQLFVWLQPYKNQQNEQGQNISNNLYLGIQDYLHRRDSSIFPNTSPSTIDYFQLSGSHGIYQPTNFLLSSETPEIQQLNRDPNIQNKITQIKKLFYQYIPMKSSGEYVVHQLDDILSDGTLTSDQMNIFPNEVGMIRNQILVWLEPFQQRSQTKTGQNSRNNIYLGIKDYLLQGNASYTFPKDNPQVATFFELSPPPLEPMEKTSKRTFKGLVNAPIINGYNLYKPSETETKKVLSGLENSIATNLVINGSGLKMKYPPLDRIDLITQQIVQQLFNKDAISLS
ncbi:MAG: hypothetical protein AABY22_24610 [Nanoarchaeota archaeon]